MRVRVRVSEELRGECEGNRIRAVWSGLGWGNGFGGEVSGVEE